MSSHSDHTQKL